MGCVMAWMKPSVEKKSCAEYLKCECHLVSRCRHVITRFRRHAALSRSSFCLLERPFTRHLLILFFHKLLHQLVEATSKRLGINTALVGSIITRFAVVPSNLPAYSASLIARSHCHHQTMIYGKLLRKEPD